MDHAPIWWYLWLGVVLVFALASLLRRRGGKRTHVPERHVPGRLGASNVPLMLWLGRDCEPNLVDEIERAGGDQQVMAAALDEVAYVGRYAMALASHEPSFSPGAPVSPFDGGPAHMGL